jgi:nicotinate-nucleotide adenylyltransferase
MRVALFGGTFDPPHRGHIGIATAAADAFGLDKVLFAPTGRQPLKLDAAPTPFAERLAMVRLACTVDARFVTSDVDAPHPNGAPNYTVETLDALRRAMPDAALFNLVGADSLLKLPGWREPERLLELAEWIVISRPGFPLGQLDSLGLTAELRLTPAQRSRIHLLESVHEDVSATELRERLHRGDRCDGLLAPAVADYIAAHGLYR